MYIAPKERHGKKRFAKSGATLLNLDRVGLNDNFFDLGGNSLLAMMTVVSLDEQQNIDLPIVKLFSVSDCWDACQFFLKNQHGRPRRFRNGLSKRIESVAERKNRPAEGDVAIIGMSGRFPGAYDVDELWEALRKGKETITFFSKEETWPGT